MNRYDGEYASDPDPPALSPFSFEDHHVRVEMILGEPWFCARDVGECLGISPSAVRTAAAALPAGSSEVVRLTDSSHGQKVTFVSEPGLYLMVMRSRKPNAERFQLWIASEVLPAIRKTGRFEIAPQTLEQRSLALLTELSTVVDRQKAEIAAQGAVLAAQAPAVAFAGAVEASAWERTPKDVFGLLGINQREGFAWLDDSKMVRKAWVSCGKDPGTGKDRRSLVRHATAPAKRSGRFTQRERPWSDANGSSPQLYVTVKGAIWIVKSVPEWCWLKNATREIALQRANSWGGQARQLMIRATNLGATP